jgi:ABC-type sugar transport system substrate-binding protein
MKKQIILAVALIFTLALIAPAFSNAVQAGAPVVVVDNKEKKDEAKTTAQPEKKADASATTEAKACCDKANKEGCCKQAKTEGKACAGQTKACAGQTKACTGEKKSSCPSQQSDK